MHPKKGWLTLAMVGLLATLLVGAGVAWAKNGVEPVKRSVVQASENNLVPQEIKDDTGGGKTGKVEKEAENVPGESITIFGKIHQEGTREPVKVFKGEPQLNVKAIVNAETGDVEFVPVKKTRVDENNLTPQEIKDETGGAKTGKIATTKEIAGKRADETSAPTNSTTATIWHKARADNYRIGWYAEAYSSNYNGGAGAESDGASVSAWYW
ncbi:MAG: hypothetical protein HPY58_02230 [Firmicutes bacterium]|nr:hypothetical protein [Bacillota bacterium]